MGNLTLDGVKVIESPLSQWPFRAAPCHFLLKATPANKTAALSAFKKASPLGKFSGLHISGLHDLSFLEDFPLLLYLEVADVKRVNTRQLDCLGNLRGLRLESPGAGIDFACFPNLEIYSGNWHVDNDNLKACRDLRRLHLWHFSPRSQDLSALRDMTRLEELEITQTTINSLSGVETLEDLRFLKVAYAPKLESLNALEGHNLQLRELDLRKAKKIASYNPIASLSYLRLLRLSDCAPMQNLKWLAGMKRLDFFAFVDTDVADGNLAPLLGLPELRYVGTADRRHYNYKMAALNELLAQRHAQAPANAPSANAEA
jgi:hypothetical protein